MIVPDSCHRFEQPNILTMWNHHLWVWWQTNCICRVTNLAITFLSSIGLEPQWANSNVFVLIYRKHHLSSLRNPVWYEMVAMITPLMTKKMINLSPLSQQANPDSTIIWKRSLFLSARRECGLSSCGGRSSRHHPAERYHRWRIALNNVCLAPYKIGTSCWS